MIDFWCIEMMVETVYISNKPNFVCNVSSNINKSTNNNLYSARHFNPYKVLPNLKNKVCSKLLHHVVSHKIMWLIYWIAQKKNIYRKYIENI